MNIEPISLHAYIYDSTANIRRIPDISKFSGEKLSTEIRGKTRLCDFDFVTLRRFTKSREIIRII
jgi:hypothetical protein